MPIKKKSVLNATQKSLVIETLEAFTDAVEKLYFNNLLSQCFELLIALKTKAEFHDRDGSARSKIVIMICEFSSSEEINLRELSIWIGRIAQLCNGLSGDLKLHKFGGWLTSEQKVSLRTLVADELQKGIERIKASEEEFTKTKRLRDTMEPTRPITDEEAQSLQLALARLVNERDKLQDCPRTRATTKKLEEIARKIAMPC